MSATTRALAVRHAIAAEEVGARLADARTRLLAARQARPQPARDDKALAAWNGLAIGALAEASVALGRPDYAAAATAAAEALWAGLRTPDGRLLRSWKDGRAMHAAVLEDHADLADGLLALYQATFEPRWFVAARELAELIVSALRRPGLAAGSTPPTTTSRSSLDPRASRTTRCRAAVRWPRSCCSVSVR